MSSFLRIGRINAAEFATSQLAIGQYELKTADDGAFAITKNDVEILACGLGDGAPVPNPTGPHVCPTCPTGPHNCPTGPTGPHVCPTCPTGPHVCPTGPVEEADPVDPYLEDYNQWILNDVKTIAKRQRTDADNSYFPANMWTKLRTDYVAQYKVKGAVNRKRGVYLPAAGRTCVDDMHSNNIQEPSNNNASDVHNRLRQANVNNLVLANATPMAPNHSTTYKGIYHYSSSTKNTYFLTLSVQYPTVPVNNVEQKDIVIPQTVLDELKITADDYKQVYAGSYGALNNPDGAVLGFGYFSKIMVVDMTRNKTVVDKYLHELIRPYLAANNRDPTGILWRLATASRGPITALGNGEFALTTQNPGAYGVLVLKLNEVTKELEVKNFRLLNAYDATVSPLLYSTNNSELISKDTWGLKGDDPKGIISYELPSTSLTNLTDLSSTTNEAVTPKVVDGKVRCLVVSSSSLAQYCVYDVYDTFLKMGAFNALDTKDNWYQATGKLTMFVEDAAGNLKPVRVLRTSPDEYKSGDKLHASSFITFPNETQPRPVKYYYPLHREHKFNDGSDNKRALDNVQYMVSTLDPTLAKKPNQWQTSYIEFYQYDSVNNQMKIALDHAYSRGADDDAVYNVAAISNAIATPTVLPLSYVADGKTYVKDPNADRCIVQGSNPVQVDNSQWAVRRNKVMNEGFVLRHRYDRLTVPGTRLNGTDSLRAEFHFDHDSKISLTANYTSESESVLDRFGVLNLTNAMLNVLQNNYRLVKDGNPIVIDSKLDAVAPAQNAELPVVTLNITSPADNRDPETFTVTVPGSVLHTQPVLKTLEFSQVGVAELDSYDANRLSFFGGGIYTESSLIKNGTQLQYLCSGASNGNYSPASDEFYQAEFAALQMKERLESSASLRAILVKLGLCAAEDVKFEVNTTRFLDFETGVYVEGDLSKLIIDCSIVGLKAFYGSISAAIDRASNGITGAEWIDLKQQMYEQVVKWRAMIRSPRGRRALYGSAFLADPVTLELKHTLTGEYDDLENRDHEIGTQNVSFNYHDDGWNRDETFGIVTAGTRWLASGNKRNFRVFDRLKLNQATDVLAPYANNDRKNFALQNYGTYGITIDTNNGKPLLNEAGNMVVGHKSIFVFSQSITAFVNNAYLQLDGKDHWLYTIPYNWDSDQALIKEAGVTYNNYGAMPLSADSKVHLMRTTTRAKQLMCFTADDNGDIKLKWTTAMDPTSSSHNNGCLVVNDLVVGSDHSVVYLLKNTDGSILKRLSFGKNAAGAMESVGACSYWGSILSVQMGFRKLGNVNKLDGTAIYHFTVGTNSSTQLWRGYFASVHNPSLQIFNTVSVPQNSLKTLAQLKAIVNSDEGRNNRLLMGYMGTTPASAVNAVVLQMPVNSAGTLVNGVYTGGNHPAAAAVNQLLNKPNVAPAGALSRADYLIDFWSVFAPGNPPAHGGTVAVNSIYKDPANNLIPYASVEAIPATDNVIAIQETTITTNFINVGYLNESDVKLGTTIPAKSLPEFVNYFPELQYDGANFINRERMITDKEYQAHTYASSRTNPKQWPDYKLEVHFEEAGQKYQMTRIYGVPIRNYRKYSQNMDAISNAEFDKLVYDHIYKILYPHTYINADGACERLDLGRLLPALDACMIKLWSSVDEVPLSEYLGVLEPHMLDADGLPKTIVSTQPGQNIVIGKLYTPPVAPNIDEADWPIVDQYYSDLDIKDFPNVPQSVKDRLIAMEQKTGELITYQSSDFGPGTYDGEEPYDFMLIVGINPDALDKNHVSIISMEPRP
jgi:hypothetical protein